MKLNPAFCRMPERPITNVSVAHKEFQKHRDCDAGRCQMGAYVRNLLLQWRHGLGPVGMCPVCQGPEIGGEPK